MSVHSYTAMLLHELNMSDTQFWFGWQMRLKISNWPKVALSLLLLSGIWFLPALNRVRKQFMPKCESLFLNIYPNFIYLFSN